MENGDKDITAAPVAPTMAEGIAIGLPLRSAEILEYIYRHKTAISFEVSVPTIQAFREWRIKRDNVEVYIMINRCVALLWQLWQVGGRKLCG